MRAVRLDSRAGTPKGFAAWAPMLSPQSLSTRPPNGQQASQSCPAVASKASHSWAGGQPSFFPQTPLWLHANPTSLPTGPQQGTHHPPTLPSMFLLNPWGAVQGCVTLGKPQALGAYVPSGA